MVETIRFRSLEEAINEIRETTTQNTNSITTLRQDFAIQQAAMTNLQNSMDRMTQMIHNITQKLAALPAANTSISCSFQITPPPSSLKFPSQNRLPISTLPHDSQKQPPLLPFSQSDHRIPISHPFPQLSSPVTNLLPLPKLSFNNKLETLSLNRCCTVAPIVRPDGRSNFNCKIFIDDVQITNLDLFNDAKIIILDANNHRNQSTTLYSPDDNLNRQQITSVISDHSNKSLRWNFTSLPPRSLLEKLTTDLAQYNLRNIVSKIDDEQTVFSLGNDLLCLRKKVDLFNFMQHIVYAGKDNPKSPIRSPIINMQLKQFLKLQLCIESEIYIFDPGGTLNIESISDLEDKVDFEGMAMMQLLVHLGLNAQ